METEKAIKILSEYGITAVDVNERGAEGDLKGKVILFRNHTYLQKKFLRSEKALRKFAVEHANLRDENIRN